MPGSAHNRSQSPDRHPQLKRLIIRPGAIGDCIVSLPAMEHLRANYTEVWVPSRNVPLIRFADRVRAIGATGLDLVGITDSPALTAMAEFDSIVSWYGTNNPDFRAAVAHLPFTFHTALPPAWTERGGDIDKHHATDFFLGQVGAPPGAAPQIDVPLLPAERFIACHAFSGSPRKNWPLERFLALAHTTQIPVVFCLGPDQDEGANRELLASGAFSAEPQLEVVQDSILRGVANPAVRTQQERANHVRVVRFDSLYNLAVWLRSAKLYIGNDSGITHLAAATGVPVIALFGQTDPAVWAPRGGADVRVVEGNRMEEITVEQVKAAVEAAIRQ